MLVGVETFRKPTQMRPEMRPMRCLLTNIEARIQASVNLRCRVPLLQAGPHDVGLRFSPQPQVFKQTNGSFALHAHDAKISKERGKESYTAAYLTVSTVEKKKTEDEKEEKGK